MNNTEAMALLTAKRQTTNDTVNSPDRFVDENGDWKADVKASKMAAI